MTFALIAVFNRSRSSWARSMRVAVVGPEVETHRYGNGRSLQMWKAAKSASARLCIG